MSYIYVFKIELEVRRIGNRNDIKIHKYCLVHYENQLYILHYNINTFKEMRRLHYF